MRAVFDSGLLDFPNFTSQLVRVTTDSHRDCYNKPHAEVVGLFIDLVGGLPGAQCLPTGFGAAAVCLAYTGESLAGGHQHACASYSDNQ